MISINIARQYSRIPGARFRTDGDFSGEQFREDFLEPHFKKPGDIYDIEIVLDGVEGYATSFLEEAFGGLARKYGKERVLRRLRFVSNEDQLLIDEVERYIRESDEA